VDVAALSPVLRLLDGGVGRAYPGAVLAVLYRGEVVLRHAVGLAAHAPAPRPALPSTIYDLASLTKVVATTPLVLRAAAEGRLGLDDPLPRLLPESPHAGVTIRHLLAHTSGLPAWIPFYLETSGYDAIVLRAAATPLASPPGAQAVYSDLGFIVLGEVARRALGAPLDDLARARVFEPLGMADARYRPGPGLRERIAPTEDGTAIEQAMAGEAGRRHTWRKTLIWGEVHDSNAHAMGGVSGHAGVFGTADDLIAYARMWLARGRGPRGPVLPPSLVSEATRRQTPAEAAARGLGWALAGPHGWWGDCLSPTAFGHTGFTGTAMVVDPAHDLAIVLLANAVHLGRDRTEILTLRPLLAAAVAQAVLGRSGGAP
jgi:CubicO group peptidase (beta-lactamase class C family)